VTSADIKNRSIQFGDLLCIVLPEGTASSALVPGSPLGPTGPVGPAGPAGPEAPRAPVGLRTPRRPRKLVIGLDVHAAGPGEVWGVLMTMPMRAPSVLGDEDVHVAHVAPLSGESADEQAACTGTVGAPTAPPGAVCIYLQDSTNAGGLVGEGVNSPQGFKLRFASSGAGDSFVDAAWAYTAP
jgi:hypothetical protein